MLGSFLLRSGLVISVHAFASDPTRGVLLLILLAVIIFSCLFHAYRRFEILEQLPNIKSGQSLKLIHAQAWLFAAAAATVLLGTVYPLISQVIWHENLSVGAPYFNQMLLPNLILALALMALILKDVLLYRMQAVVHFIISVVVSFIIFKSISAAAIAFTIVLFSLSITLYSLCKPSKQKRLFLISHSGFMIMLIGVIVSSSFGVDNTELLAVGDSINITENKTVSLKHISEYLGPNYKGIKASFQYQDKNIEAEDRIYNASSISLPKVGIITSVIGSDIYLAISASKQGWVVRSYYKPLIRWIWFGGLIMVLGAILLILDRRKACD